MNEYQEWRKPRFDRSDIKVKKAKSVPHKRAHGPLVDDKSTQWKKISDDSPIRCRIKPRWRLH